MPDSKREIQVVVRVREDKDKSAAWRTAFTSGTITVTSAPADIIKALDDVVTKLETMTGLH